MIGSNAGSVNYSYYDLNTSSKSDDDGRGTPKTTEEMMQQTTFTNWDFTNIWGIVETINYPYLQMFGSNACDWDLVALHGADGNAGPQGPPGQDGNSLGFIWQGDFNCNRSYASNDIVYFNGSSYIADTNISAGGIFSGWVVDEHTYTHRKKITILSTNVDANLTNFPLLVNINADSDVGAAAMVDGNDIRFTLADGNRLLFAEKEDFNIINNAATGNFWVKMPTLTTGTDTNIYMYYGATEVSAQTNAISVWDSNYVGVWHFKENDSNIWKDSTINGINSNGGTATLTSGKIGNSVDFNGSNFIDLPGSTAFNNQSFTISLWLNPSLAQESAVVALVDYDHASTPNQGWVIQSLSALTDKNYNIQYYNGSSWQPAGQTGKGVQLTPYSWQYISFNKDGTSVAGYKNDTSVWTATGSEAVYYAASRHIRIGNIVYPLSRYYKGVMDELRISSSARSATWIKFEYHNINDVNNNLIIWRNKMDYTVIYSTEVNAETPEEAALIVEDFMRNGIHRPFLNITDENGKSTEIDLEDSELSLKNIER